VPVFRGGEPRGDRTLFWSTGATRRYARAAGSWCRIAPGWELYDLAADRTEQVDLAARHPARLKRMQGLYERWAGRAGAVPYPFPVRRDRLRRPPF
jgi:arylsulfatase